MRNGRDELGDIRDVARTINDNLRRDPTFYDPPPAPVIAAPDSPVATAGATPWLAAARALHRAVFGRGDVVRAAGQSYVDAIRILQGRDE